LDRKDFFKAGMGCCAFALFEGHAPAQNQSEELAQLQREKQFIENWLADLLDTMESVLDEKTRVKLMEGCGRGCFRRHQFKQDIAAQGKGSLEKLIEAYKKNFQVWQDDEGVHIRYGEVAKQCYCPAARNRAPKPNDLHCECTRSTHQTVFETALGRPLKVDILETLRRGGKTCHFVVRGTM
jgi:hypothetical protein